MQQEQVSCCACRCILKDSLLFERFRIYNSIFSIHVIQFYILAIITIIIIFTLTVVVESYLKDLVWPFSKKTLRTFAICGTCKSPKENADGCKEKGKTYLISLELNKMSKKQK